MFGVHVLNLKKVPKDRIYVCTSHIAAAQYLNPYGISSIHPIDQLDAVLIGLSCEMLVLVVGGHGRPDGVGQGKRALSPAETVTKARSITGLRAGVIILSQCFAGVFNLMDAETHPPLVLIGATNLNESLSTGVDLQNPIPQDDGLPGLKSWLANIFSLYFFNWFVSQPDVDGDGELTILDAFKAAGAGSNQQLINEKTGMFVRAQVFVDELRALEQLPLPQDPQQAVAHVLKMKATEQRLRETLKMLYLHQEPWLLNARLARRVAVAL